MSEPKLYALLVGVNKYKTEEFSNLLACENDVKAMNKLLKKKFKEENRAIKCLVNEEATKGNIINSFETHLSEAQKDDFVLFYYSGHGATEKTPPKFLPFNPSFQIETIVCHDSRTGDVFDLADKEIAVLLSKAAVNDPQIIVILDCCHSGSATRGEHNDNKEEQKKVNVRQGDMNNRTRAATSFYGYEQGDNFEPPSSPHILMAACRNRQLAKEAFLGITFRGVFSYGLTEVLNDNPDVNYIDLFQKAQSFIAIEGFDQTPQFQTVGLTDPFFGFLSKTRNEDEQILPVVKQGFRSYINKGYLSLKHYDFSQAGHGLKVGIYEQDDEVNAENLLMETTTYEIGHNKTYIDLPRSLAKSQEQLKAAILSFPKAPFSIAFEGEDEEWLKELESTVEEESELFVKISKETVHSDYKFVVEDEVLNLYYTPLNILLQGVKGMKRPATRYMVGNIIKKIVDWHWVIDFQNPEYHSKWLPNKQFVEQNVIEFRPDNVDFWVEVDGHGELRADDDILEIEMEEGQKIGVSVKAQNKTGSYIQATHVYLGQAYDIITKTAEIETSDPFAFISRANLKMEPGLEVENYYFKIIASKEPFPEIIKSQKAIQLGEILEFNQDLGPDRALYENDSAISWFSKIIQLQLKRK